MFTPPNRSLQLQLALRQLHQAVPECQTVLLVNSDGLLLAAYPPTTAEDDLNGGEAVAAMASVLLRLAMQTTEHLAQGVAQRVLVQAPAGILAVFPVGVDSCLALRLAPDAKVGLALQLAQQATTRLASLVA